MSNLSRPPRIKGRAQVDALFEMGRPTDYEELGRLIYQSDSERLVGYVGTRVGAELCPEQVGLACDIMRLRSYHGIAALLSNLAQREFATLFASQPSVTEGPEYAELRRLIADVAVWPEYAFSERDVEKYGDNISNVTSFPITILRRSAGREVDDTVVKAVTRGGLCVDTIRRGLEILTLRESSSADRVLSDEAMIAIARTLTDPLRDPFTRVLVVSLVDRWLAKQQPLFSRGDIEIRNMLHSEWLEFAEKRIDLTGRESITALDAVRLMRHFEDPVTGLALKNATLHPHPTVSLVAKLLHPDQRESALSLLEHRLLGDVPTETKIHAVRVFGQPISPELDEDLWPIFDRYIRDAWELAKSEEADVDDVVTARVMVLQATLRRFFSEPASGPFLSNLFGSFKSENAPMTTVAVNTLTQVASLGQVPPLSFYEDFKNLIPVAESVRILSDALKKDPTNESAREMLEKLQAVFIHQGPSSYGFELEVETKA